MVDSWSMKKFLAILFLSMFWCNTSYGWGLFSCTDCNEVTDRMMQKCASKANRYEDSGKQERVYDNCMHKETNGCW